MPRPTVWIATLLAAGLIIGMAVAEDLPGLTAGRQAVAVLADGVDCSAVGETF